MTHRTIKGTHDILPDQSIRWQKLEAIIHRLAAGYGYKEIRTPILEETSLFSRAVGEDTDIVVKEMYSWEDSGGLNITLRPELTAPVVRAYIQHNLSSLSPLHRLYYIGSLFRRERPQKGRQRQFHQFGVEAFGSKYPEQDAEIISIANSIFQELGLTTCTLQLNSIGSAECRLKYKKALQEYFKPFFNDFSETSKRRFESNTLRILDTKIPYEQEIVQNAPPISEYLSDEDKAHFDSVQELLTSMNITFERNERMVRGLDYYSRTTFEFTSAKLGAQDALCGGGRYDGLVETLGGKSTPAVGFAAGIERILMIMETKDVIDNSNSIYIINLVESASGRVLKLANDLRSIGMTVYTDTIKRSLKSQLRDANRLGVKTAVILGEKELKNRRVQVKDLAKGEQEEVDLNKVVNHFTI